MASSSSAHSALSLLSGSRKPSADESSNLAAPSIHAIATARIYHTHLDSKHSNDWVYSRLKGTLTFGRNWSSSLHGSAGINRESLVVGESGSAAAATGKGMYWFTLADDMTGKTIWMFQVPVEGFMYEVDRPFFHVFNGRTRKYGFLFDDDDEASLFSRKVINETCKDAYAKHNRRNRVSRNTSQRRSKSLTSRLSHSQFRGLTSSTSKVTTSYLKSISAPAPNSFRHISHVGVNAFGVFEISKDLDGAFKDSLIKLSGGAGADANVDTVRAERGSIMGVDAHVNVVGQVPASVSVC